VRGVRTIPAGAFYTGVKRNALAEDELIAAILIPRAAGPQQFSKIGTRNAMVIAVASFCISLNAADRTVGTGIGSAAPTPRRALDAEVFLAGALAGQGLWESRADLPASVVSEFGEKVKAAASPVDDVRGTAAYRRRGLAVMARRTLTWAWHSFQAGGG
jgi:CO/xanthine dehydrogenase FAD-binding subunit